jgi:hypothetical protein
MSKLINESNKLRWKTARASGNQVAIFEVEGVTYRSSTPDKRLPASYDKKIYVATDDADELVVNEFTTTGPNAFTMKMVPFEGFDNISQRDLVSHAADVKFAGTLGMSY